tara:strand:- start:3935 stop:4282 length:348 start_codon:yes stop_codon:yes gene_type:complete
MGNINNSQESKSWSKLDKTSRLKALINYAESYKNEKGLDDGKYSLMVNYFKECLDNKKLNRVKDVIYDKDKKEILDIPGLMFNKNINSFTIRNNEKYTIRNTAPKKKTTVRIIDS